MKPKQYTLPLLLSGLCLLASSHARAHDPPQGVDLVWAAGAAAGDSPHVVVTNRGLVFMGEGGAATSSRLRCNEALSVPTTLPPTVLARADGSLVAATYQGVALSDDSACTSSPASGVPEQSLSPVLMGADAWLMATRTVDTPSRVIVSTDEGASWSERYAGVSGVYLDKLFLAPSRPERVYASGLVLEDGGRSSLCAVSDDSGRSFTHKARTDDVTPFAVHPTQPDVVFAHQFADAIGSSFRVLRSVDACDSFTPVLEGLPVMPSGMVGGGDAPLFLGVGGPGGLYRSDDQGQSFAKVAPELVHSVTCLLQRGARLWLCANLVPNVSGIWYSDDQGASFQSFLTFDQVAGPVVCATGAERAVCAQPWYDYFIELHPDGAGSSMDGGIVEDAAAASDAGEVARKHADGCQLAPARARRWYPWTLATLAGIAMQRRKRRRESER